jgi:enolase
MVNMISGGLHAGQRIEVQDFLIIPRSAQSFRQAMELIFRIHRQLGTLLRKYGYEADLVADEGGYGPRLHKSEQALEFLVQAIRESGLQEGKDIVIAIDLAATHFYRDGRYDLATVNKKLSSSEMLDYLAGWLRSYPIISLEDPLAENDWEGWAAITRRWGHLVQLVGDDLFATNPMRLRDGISQGIANAILIKPNQVGTLSETFEVMRIAQQAGYRMVLSARSGETEENWLADLAVATGVGQIKIGCITRGERLAKYNQLLRIEDWLGDKAQLARI